MAEWMLRGSIVLTVTFVIWLAYVIGAAYYWQKTVGKLIERDLGFQYGTPYIQETGSSWPQEVLTIESIQPGGTMDRAGFKSGDIVRGMSINELFRTLHRGRGQTISIRVVDGGDGTPVDQRQTREITFVVPTVP